MSHAQVVYKLVRGGQNTYCTSFAVVSALLGMGWALRDWGRRARFARDIAVSRRRGVVARTAANR